MIITGAPVEQIDYEKIDYWDEICGIMDYARKNVFSTLYICWGAQAGLYHHYKIPKITLSNKMFGIYMNRKMKKTDPLLRGFDDFFPIPQSRHTTIDNDKIEKCKDLTVLAKSDEVGITLVKSKDNHEIFMTGHLEYDTATLGDEYMRDKKKGLPIQIPYNYYPNNDPTQPPVSTWRSTAHLFYSNWLNYYVYQETPFDFV